MEPKQPKQLKGLERIKYLAWCLSQTPPPDAGFDFDDLLQYAKFQLSVQKRVLLKDPIWASYTDEELLVEYFANVFEKSEDARKQFQDLLTSGDKDEFLEWAEKMEKESGEGDKIEFSPDELGD